jgi:low affinity Fe/Cu permease
VTARDAFAAVARRVEAAVGSPWATLAALATVVAWAATGPLFGWSDTWQLVINTGTTIVTFLMVFLIQNAQTRDVRAIHLKLDELLRATTAARTELAGTDELPIEEINRLREEVARDA